VLLPDGDDGVLDGEPDLVESDGGLVDGGVAVGGGVVVGGDAEGVRSNGRSPTRSFGDSEQPATSPTLAPSRTSALSKLFITLPPTRGLDGFSGCNRGATQRRP
jgi:hypothetical protein